MPRPQRRCRNLRAKSARPSQRYVFSLSILSRFTDRVPQAEATTPVLESSSAALIEKAPEASEIQAGAVAPDLVVQPEPETAPVAEEDIVLKLSPIVDLIHKRLKVTSKKIVRPPLLPSTNTLFCSLFEKQSRISTYASTDPEKLNDDQKATLKTLPALEAVQKELGEVKKAVEVSRLRPSFPQVHSLDNKVHEAQLVTELTQKRQEAEKSEKMRIASAVSAAEVSNTMNHL